MAYTFGGATTDDANTSLNLSWGSASRPFLITGWWYPTTLTAGRLYFGSGGTHGMSVGPTTSELRLIMDRVTTDGVWDTTSAGIAIDTWRFIAWLGYSTSGDASHTVWIGTVETPPAEVSLTNSTAVSGGASGSSPFAIGNQGVTGSLSFQGDIESVFFFNSSNTTSPAGSQQFNFRSSGDATHAETKEYTYARWVLPLWLGNHVGPDDLLFRASHEYQEGEWFPFLVGSSGYRMSSVATLTDVTTTLSINGATASQSRGPRPYPNPTFSPYLRR